MAATLLPLLFLTAQVRAQSALDGFDPNANDMVRVVVVQPDGKILIGGDFTTLSPNGRATVTRNRIARLNPDGTLDTAFDPNVGGPGSNVFSIALQVDGKVLVGGIFTNVSGLPRHNIARLDATTGLADSFDPNANGGVYSIALQSDGKILAGGGFGMIGGQERHRIARLDPTTGLADSFDPDPWVYSIAVQADGKILAGGLFNGPNGIGGETRNRIARLDPTSGLADSFDPNASGTVFSIAVQADGKILAGGTFTSIGGQTRNHLGRLDSTTGLADSFDPNANVDVVFAIAAQADGKVLAVGDFTTLAPNGGAPVFRRRIGRLETDGRLDQTLDLAPITGSIGHASAVQPDGKILIGGTFTSILGAARNNIARLNADGTLDPAFNPDANHWVYVLAVQTDGKILVAGDFESIGGQNRNNIARLDPVTGLADSFDPNANGYITSIVVQADGKILVGGAFTNIGGQARNYVARLDPITGLADSWDAHATHAGDGASFPEINSIAVQADGLILVGGTFAAIGGQTRPALARIDPNTALADPFDAHFTNGHVRAIAVQTDGRILVGGLTRNSTGVYKNLVRLNTDGSLDTSFNPNADGIVFSVTLQANGKILVGGLFSNIGGQQRSGLARFDAANGFADSFALDGTARVNSITVQPDGKILVGGSLFFSGEVNGRVFARLTNDAAALQDLAATPTAITWTRTGASPLLTRATFEVSTDNANYTFLGNGTPAGSSWTLAGLNLPTDRNIYIRARGYYRGGSSGGSESITESVRNAFIPEPGTLGNISTRLRVQAGDNAMIGGFIITGTQPKTVVVRGLGPSLPVPGALADPVIEVHGASGELLGTNDNWNDALTRQQIIDSGLAPGNDLESALWGTINPGAYTVVVRGKNDTAGVGLFEVYGLDQTVDSRLANISTRGLVETGDNVMVGGTIIIGSTPARVLFRAIGPSLTALGLPNALPDPTLELHDGNGELIASNDNWRTDEEAAIIATGVPPANDLESAIVRDLAPGSYTAIVRGADNSTGVALVEAYGLN